jgi:hypothetical protein
MNIRFSTKTLLALVTLVAILAGAFSVRLHRSHRQREAVANSSRILWPKAVRTT